MAIRITRRVYLMALGAFALAAAMSLATVGPATAGPAAAPLAAGQAAAPLAVGPAASGLATVGPAAAPMFATGYKTKLVLEDGAAYDNFGYELAFSGDTLLVLAFMRGEEDGAMGSIISFVRDGATWNRQAEVKAATYAPDDWTLEWFMFERVALSGDTALVSVSARWNGDPKTYKRWVYVFVRSGTTWGLQAILSVDDPHARYFGESLAIVGDTALVAAPDPWSDTNGEHDAVYVYHRSGTNWSQQGRLTPNESVSGFGRSLAFSGDTALVGGGGAVHVFTRSGTSWIQQAKLTTGNESNFGSCVALSGDTALIGDPNAPGAWDDGAAYVFTRSGSTWTREAKLTGVSQLGKQVALSGDVALVATDFAAGVYMRSNTGWHEQSWLYSYDGIESDEITSLALAGETALLGVPRDDIGANKEQGSIYAYGLVRDVKRPTTKAYPASVKKGRKAKLVFRVNDPEPSCGRATVTLKIYRRTKLKQTIEVKGTCLCNFKKTYSWKCRLPKGVYTWKVFATDVAGNAQSKVGGAKLTVK
jgi:hypothetical protein